MDYHGAMVVMGQWWSQMFNSQLWVSVGCKTQLSDLIRERCTFLNGTSTNATCLKNERCSSQLSFL